MKATKSRHGKLIVPDVLPAELLTDSESDGDGTGSSVRKSASATRQPEGAARPSKITFPEAARKMGREDRAPADERVGSTIFKVVKNLDDPRIPPKKKKSSLSIRMSLLARKRMPQAQNRGFFGKRN